MNAGVYVYPSVCPRCIVGDHKHCLTNCRREDDPERTEWWNPGAFCICPHGDEENAWQREVRERVESIAKGSS